MTKQQSTLNGPNSTGAMGRGLAGLAIAAAVMLAACQPPGAGARGSGTGGEISLPPEALSRVQQLSGLVTADGSSTVFPVTEAMAEEFQRVTGGRVRVTVGISGTGGGFQKFCAGETDISDASRPISAREIEACKTNGIQYVELPVAFDGLSVLVNPRNTWASCMTKSELRRIWEPDAQGQVTRWNQVRPDWPDAPLTLYGPGSDSGTFDYFTDAINGREKASRGDYTASEDDNVLVQGITNDVNALGYFGYAYYVENQSRLKLVALDNEQGGGCVTPSPDSIQGGTYQPLSRPIFIYAKQAALARPEVKEFVRFYLHANVAPTLIRQVGYVPFPQDIYGRALQRLEANQVGTIFGGQPAPGMKLEDLFSRPPIEP